MCWCGERGTVGQETEQLSQIRCAYALQNGRGTHSKTNKGIELYSPARGCRLHYRGTEDMKRLIPRCTKTHTQEPQKTPKHKTKCIRNTQQAKKSRVRKPSNATVRQESHTASTHTTVVLILRWNKNPITREWTH